MRVLVPNIVSWQFDASVLAPGRNSMCHTARVHDLWTGDAIQLSVTVQSAAQQLRFIKVQEQAIEPNRLVQSQLRELCVLYTVLSARLTFCNY